MKQGDTSEFATDGVERSAPGVAPSAFRIWHAGSNPTDHGDTVFSERSATMLMEEQERRGNKYSIDVGHATLDKSSPIENQRAVGWHRLEVRGGELWAVDVEWAEWVAEGFEASPPAWKYFSPAYDCDPITFEVISYTNTAITSNPATWHVTTLADRRGFMKYDEAVAALKKMAEGAADDEDTRRARRAYAEMMKHEAKRARKAADEADDESKKAAETKRAEDAEAEASKHADDDDDDDDGPPPSKAPPSSKKAPPPPKKSEADARVSPSGLAAVLARTEALEARVRENEERSEREQLMASRPDVSKDTRKFMASLPIEHLREAVKSIPKSATRPAASAQASVKATQGANQTNDDTANLPRLSTEDLTKDAPQDPLGQRAWIKAKMGRPLPASEPIRAERNTVIYGVLTPQQAAARVAAKGAR